MILFTILLITLVVLAILAVLCVAVLGAAGIVVFGDVIVCAVIIALIIRHFIRKKQLTADSADIKDLKADNVQFVLSPDDVDVKTDFRCELIA